MLHCQHRTYTHTHNFQKCYNSCNAAYIHLFSFEQLDILSVYGEAFIPSDSSFRFHPAGEATILLFFERNLRQMWKQMGPRDRLVTQISLGLFLPQLLQ